jgi:hypothetical protein
MWSIFMNPMLTISDEEFGLIGVKFDRWDGSHACYKWTVEVGGRIYEDSDLRVGASDHLNDTKALVSLLGFLSAFAEAVEYDRRNDARESENGDLFPEELRDWAEQIGSDGFSMLADNLGDDE